MLLLWPKLTIIEIEYKNFKIMIESTVINKSIVENGWEISNSPIYAEIAWRISPVSSSGASHETSPSLPCRSVMEVSPAFHHPNNLDLLKVVGESVPQISW